MRALFCPAVAQERTRLRRSWRDGLALGASICIGFVALWTSIPSANGAPSDLDGAWGQNGIVTLDGTWLAEGKLQFGRDLILAYLKTGESGTVDRGAQVVRLEIGGRLDAAFGVGGALQPTCSTPCSVGGALDVMPDGRVVARGDKGFVGYGSCQDVWIDRFLPNGRPDASFGTAGRFEVGRWCRFGQFVVNAWGEGFYPAASWTPAGYSYTGFIIGSDAAGTIADAFGPQTDRYADGLVARWGYSGALAADAKRRVWAAAPHSPNEDIAIVRFLDRKLDSTFGSEGRAVAHVPAVVRMDRMALDDLGGVIVTGIAEIDGVRQLVLVRFIDRGIVDTGFGRAGIVYIALAATGEEVQDVRLAVQADGRIVVAATVQHAANADPRFPRIAVARLLPDGSPDLRFAGGGVTNLWTQWGTSVQFVAVRATGEIIVGGNSIAAYSDVNPAYVPVVFQLKGGDLVTPKPPRERRAVEYFHRGYGHYFMTADADEIASLDMSTGADVWTRTGKSFGVWDVASAEVIPVCRFWSDQSFAPKSSHFYTPYADECALVKTNPTWLFERNSFYARVPEGTPGARTCPPTTQPLYRAYNNGISGAPNHRYTTDPVVLDVMIAQGWIMEGEAATHVFACVPAPE